MLTDRLHAMQWAWWIPRPIFPSAALVWLLVVEAVALAARIDRRDLRGNRAALLVAALASSHAFLGIWRPSSPRPADAVRVVHWNASFIERADYAPIAVGVLLGLDADLVVVTDPGLLWTGDGVERFAAAGYEIRLAGRFGVASRIGFTEARPVLAQGRMLASRIEVETRFGPLAIEAIDLPSDPWRARMQTMRTFAEALSAQRDTYPDLVIGDFNITRGSASLAALGDPRGARYREAFAAAGSGWGGTYPRTRPWWPIDLALVGGRWTPARSEIVDPGEKRHRLQVVDLAPRRG